ncbi:MAG: Rne/Rng family ribonuclease, partial [Rhizobiaceae bacterium]
IDAGHPEETRVVMVRGNRVDEFDFESEHKTQLRGNIYLAKVTRVEPSLQAAFVDYGGNRHGFLAFSEIHPDYYQIPMADRQALLDEEAEDAREAAAQEAAQDDDADSDSSDGNGGDNAASADGEEVKAKPARKRRSRRRSKSKDEAAEDEQADTAENKADAEAGDESAESEAVSEESSDADNSSSDDTSEESDDDSTTMAAENDGDDVVSEPAPKPKKATRRPRKKKADAEAEAAAEPSSESAEVAADEAVAEEKPKPKRRRTSRKKAEPEAEAAAEAEVIAEAPVETEAATEPAAEAEDKPKRRRTSRKKKAEPVAESTDESAAASSAAAADGDDEGKQSVDSVTAEEPAAEAKDPSEEGDAEAQQEKKPRRSRSRSRSRRRKNNDDSVEATNDGENGESVEELGSEDALEEVPTRRAPRRHYKIQEVIKRRQILLVQVVKEERGNKGAALTTYLSLAGRYSVLMPNTARGGGISRKITNAADRKRLKAIASNLEVPQGMGVILRTAGASRQPEDIQRDFEYLMRLWENVRNLTLESTAPHLVYEEGSLIKRSIRDLYDKDTGEILVAGEDGYREAKDFMTMLMPNHAKNVKLYRDRIPMFARMGVEAQLDAMLQPEVTLKSGGYIIIDQTEALVAIDVNSGRSTRQHSIEETAVQTNLEAADEVARQLRLRDLAGLIVIDFIDMEEKRNIRSVEKRLKEALKDDRARIQVGRISHFGLMEMSRQRIRASVLESTTQTCSVCEGLGHVRATSSVAISVLRSIEEQLNRNSRHNLTVKVTTETALYMLNQKRESVGDLESRFNVSISIATDDALGNTPCSIERGEVSQRRKTQDTVQPDSIDVMEDDDSPAEASEIQSEIQVSEGDDSGDGQGTGKKRRRRRRRRKGSGGGDGDEVTAASTNEDGAEASAEATSPDGEAVEAEQVNGAAVTEPDGEDAEAPKGRVRRTRRSSTKSAESKETSDDAEEKVATEAAAPQEQADTAEKKPTRTRRKRATKKKDDAEAALEAPAEEAAPAADASEEEAKPKRRTTRRKKVTEAASEPTADVEPAEAPTEAPSEAPASTMAAEATEEVVAEAAPKKSGWWQRKFF